MNGRRAALSFATSLHGTLYGTACIVRLPRGTVRETHAPKPLWINSVASPHRRRGTEASRPRPSPGALVDTWREMCDTLFAFLRDETLAGDNACKGSAGPSPPHVSRFPSAWAVGVPEEPCPRFVECARPGPLCGASAWQKLPCRGLGNC